MLDVSTRQISRRTNTTLQSWLRQLAAWSNKTPFNAADRCSRLLMRRAQGKKQNNRRPNPATHARAAPLSTSDATPRAVHRNHACCNDAAQSHKQNTKNCTDAARPDAARGAPPTAARVERTTHRDRAPRVRHAHAHNNNARRVTIASRTFRSPTSVAARSSSPSTRCPAS